VIKILARSVDNLTVARYFASMSVDIISFNYSFEDTKKIKEIIDWIDGPAIAIELISPINKEEFDIMVSNLNPNIIITNHSLGYATELEVIHINHLSDIDISNKAIIIIDTPIDEMNNAEIEKLENLDNSENLFLHFDDITDRDIIFASESGFGVVLQAGEEDKIGIKSFDDLDYIFDFINEELV
jgi:hypothetical protein